MLVRGDHAGSPEAEPGPTGDELFEVPDPAGPPSLNSAEEFTAVMDRMVASRAPRLFAVVQEHGDRVNARIAAWGMAFTDHAEIVSVDGTLRMGLQAPDTALCCFAWDSYFTPRLVWVNPDETTSAEDSEAV